jgi:hypothetical protein
LGCEKKPTHATPVTDGVPILCEEHRTEKSYRVGTEAGEVSRAELLRVIGNLWRFLNQAYVRRCAGEVWGEDLVHEVLEEAAVALRGEDLSEEEREWLLEREINLLPGKT